MAGVIRLAFTQLAAIAKVRRHVFINRLRTGRGKFELLSKILIFGLHAFIAVVPAIGLGFGAREALLSNKTDLLAGLLWLIFIAWQFLPALAMALTESWDTTSLLRFPVNPVTYSLVWILYGSLDPATFIAGLWLLAILVGVCSAATSLAPWATLVLLSFALMNVLLSRLVAAWLSRWLAQKRTREILGLIFMLVAIGNPLLAKTAERYIPHYLHSPIIARFAWISHISPPGIMADSISHMRQGLSAAAVIAIAPLCGYVALFACLLAIRLRAEYFGENLSESVRRERVHTSAVTSRSGIEIFGASHPVAAVFEKELRTLFRSPQLFFAMLLVPPFVLLVFGKFGASATLSRSADLGLAFGLANGLLALTRVVFNNLGAEKSGVQFYFLAPVRFRQVIAGKNLAHATILLMQSLLVLTVVVLLFGIPTATGLALTFTALLFAAITNISVGNIFTFFFPKKEDYSLNRHSGSAASVLAALGVQVAVLAITVPLFVTVRRQGVPWLGVLAFLVLTAIAVAFYSMVLNRVDKLAIKRREEVIAELCRTT